MLQLWPEHHSAACHQPGLSVQWMLSVLEVRMHAHTCTLTHTHLCVKMSKIFVLKSVFKNCGLFTFRISKFC